MICIAIRCVLVDWTD